jgi:pimeloyl-ACP methyl ester carboxylesterase
MAGFSQYSWTTTTSTITSTTVLVSLILLVLSSVCIQMGNSMNPSSSSSSAGVVVGSGRARFEAISGPPPGKFCETTHGTTHYCLEGGEITDDADSQQRPPLVILQHGIGGDLQLLDRMAKDLIAEGYRVLRYDLYDRGYSETDPQKYPIRRLGLHPLKFTLDVYIQQLQDVLKHVIEEEEEDEDNNNDATTTTPTKFIHVGHSLGGLVGIAYAARHPDQVVGLALMDAVCLPVTKPLMAKISNLPVVGDFLAERFGASTFQKFARSGVVDPDHEIVGPFLQKQCENVATNPRYFSSIRSSNQHCQGMVGSAEDLFRKCCEASIPIHLVWGKADTSVPYENCLEMKRIAQDLLKTATVTEDAFEDMPHNVFFEDAKPLECSKSVCDFVSKVCPIH